MTKKKFLTALVFAALLAAGAFGFSACKQAEHEHIFSEEWSTDGIFHWHACTVPGCGVTTEKEDHKITFAAVSEATCTQEGENAYICNICGYEDRIQLSPLGHDLVHHDAKAATCTEPGWNAYETCSRCDYSTYTELPALQHDLQHYDAKAATCTESGWTAYETCSRCGYSTYTELPAIRHQLSSGGCLRCGKDAAVLLNGTYGYEFLGTLPNGEGMQELYRAIDAAVNSFHTDAESDAPADFVLAVFDYAGYGLTDEESISVWKTYKDDNPLYYWLSNTAQINATEIRLLIEDDYAAADTRAYYNAMIDDALNICAEQIFAGASAYDTALACHDLIIRAADYTESGSIDEAWAHNILGVLEYGSAVCEGYARTFQMLLNFAGVENLFVTGDGNGESHAWNLVKLDDGNWYWCDLTYDDQPAWQWGTSYDYFCVTDENFLSDHTCDASSGTSIEFLYDLPARAESAYADDGFQLGEEFIVDACAYEIIGYNAVALRRTDIEGALAIPETVEYGGRDFTVTAICPGMSSYIEKLDGKTSKLITSVSIPKTVEYIGDMVFRHAPLENISVDADNPCFTARDGVLFTKSLYTLIQYPNAHARTEYTIPDQTKIIAQYAFYECSHLEKLVFGKNVSTLNFANWGDGYPDKQEGGNIVGNGIMSLYEALTGKKEIIFNDFYSIDDIGVYNAHKTTLFYIHDKTITEYCVPANLQMIDFDTSATGPFSDCYALERFTVEEGNLWFAVQDGILYNKAMTEIECIPAAVKGEITIPEGVTAIGMEEGIGRVFENCSGLTKVNLPSSLKIIGTIAFDSCVSLQSIEIPDGVTFIGLGSFRNCTELNEITIPRSVTTIEHSAFDRCTNLTEVYFADPEGWSVDGQPIDAELLSNPETAAKLLTETYFSNNWQKN